MTDLPPDLLSVPSMMAVSLALDDGLLATLEPRPVFCDRGTVPVSFVVLQADVLAGLSVDTDPDAWTFTSDISVRIPAVPPPPAIAGRIATLRAGARSITCEVPLTVDGSSWGSCFIGFARVPRRAGDPPKPSYTTEQAVAHWSNMPVLEQTLRDAIGFEERDPARGALAVDLRPDLLNPAGALQGAMVSYLAEAAAEDLADHHLPPPPGGGRWVATEIDLRFLAQNRIEPIVSSASFVGPPEEGLVRVDLRDDDGAGRLTAAAALRLRPGPPPG